MRKNIMKIVAIGLFTVALLLNVSVYFDSNDQNADISLGSLKVSLFQRAYGGYGGNTVQECCRSYGCNGGNTHCAYCNGGGFSYECGMRIHL